VIAVIGILLALLLPAVQAAREAASLSTCANQLKQIAMGFHLHLGAHGHFPTDGWGDAWVGDADRGAGRDQTGGWTFNILPYIEQSALYQLAGDGLPDEITEQQLAGAAQAVQIAIPWINCPTRRGSGLHPLRDTQYVNAHHTDRAARTDYVANWGDSEIVRGPGPDNLAAGIRGVGFIKKVDSTLVTGVVFYRSTIRISQIGDGTTNTYMVGENTLPRDWLTALPGHSPLASGHVGSAAWIPLHDPEASPQHRPSYRFGSAHPGGWLVATCDGSVRRMDFGVAPEIHRRLANRDDGQPMPAQL
jgi:type II secretory pathway pseudopilin PulG